MYHASFLVIEAAFRVERPMATDKTRSCRGSGYSPLYLTFDAHPIEI